MIKKVMLMTLATFMAVGFMSGNVYAEPENDLDGIQEKREDIKEDLSEKESKVKELISEIKALNEDVKRGNAAIEEKEELIDGTEQKISDTIKDIHSLQDDIKELEAAIEERYNILKERLSSYQKSGGRVDYLDVLLGSEDFSDFTSRVSLVTQITDTDVALMEQIDADTKDVEDKQELALEKLGELNDVKDEQENALASIDDDRQENEARIETLSEKQEELISSRDELELEDSDLAALENETKDSIAAAAEAKEKAEQQAKMEAEEKERAEKKAQAKEKEQAKKKSEKKVLAKEAPKNDEADKNNETDDADADKGKAPDKGEKSFTVTATAYTADGGDGEGITATGIDLKKNPDKKVIAVDPEVIPLGSIVKVEGYGYAIAGDTGGAINGKKIDVFVPTEKEAAEWGVRRVKVTIQ